MSWDIPDIPGAGTIATVAGWATKIISCLRYLKGLDSQVPTIQSGLVIDNTGGDEYFKLPLLTTAQTSTVLATEGKVAFDSQTHTPKYYNGTAVKDIGDHGSLGGLTDDDHTQYIQHSLADAANDFLVASGADTFVKKTLAETKIILDVVVPKVKAETRDSQAASGDVSYTGYGFTPTGLIVFASYSQGGTIGSSDPAKAVICFYLRYATPPYINVGAYIVRLTSDDAAGTQSAVVTTYDADGFTLTWTKAGTPAAGTINLTVFAFK